MPPRRSVMEAHDARPAPVYRYPVTPLLSVSFRSADKIIGPSGDNTYRTSLIQASTAFRTQLHQYREEGVANHSAGHAAVPTWTAWLPK